MAWFGGVLITNGPNSYYSGNNKVSSLAVDQDGNILLAGLCNYPESLPTYPGPNGTSFLLQGSFVAKVNAAGTILWTRSTGKSTSILGVVSDKNGNVYVSGCTNNGLYFPIASFRGPVHGGNALLTKYDPRGNFFWSLQSSGNGQDAGTRMTLDGSNNLYLIGFFSSTNFVLGSTTLTNVLSVAPYGSFYPEEEFIAKIDPEGKVLWAKPIFGTTMESWLNPPKLDSSGNIILDGIFDHHLKLDNLTFTNKVMNDLFHAIPVPEGAHILSW